MIHCVLLGTMFLKVSAKDEEICLLITGSSFSSQKIYMFKSAVFIIVP